MEEPRICPLGTLTLPLRNTVVPHRTHPSVSGRTTGVNYDELVSLRQLRTAAEGAVLETRNAANIAAHTAAILHELGDETGSRAAQHLTRSLPHSPASIVVAGEFKAGKTSLVNAILGGRVLPADLLSTTPVPCRVVAGGETELSAWVQRAAGEDGDDAEVSGAAVDQQLLDREQFLDLLGDEVPRLGGALVDHLEVRLPQPLLELGIRLVDTPSISGGITSAMAGIVLGEVAVADALLFVSDASQELTAAELEFLKVAASLDTKVLVVMTKTDLYPSWRRLLDRNHDHLETAFGQAPVIFATSANLRRYAVRYADETLDIESGVPLLVWYLVANVLTEARQHAIVTAGEVLQRRLAEAEDSVASARRALASAREHRLVQAQLAATLERASRLEQQWQPRLRLELDRFQLDSDADLGERLQFVSRLMAQTIDSHDPQTQWPIIESQFNEAVNRATAGHIHVMQERARQVYRAMEDFLGIPSGSLTDGRVLELEDRPIAVELDRPDLDVDASAQVLLAGGNVSRYAWVAGSAVGAVLTGFGMGIPAMVAAAVAGVGVGGGGAMFWRHKTRSSALEESRRRARAQAQLDVGEAARAAAHVSRAARSELNMRLQDDIIARIGALKAQLHQEVAQLKMIADVADESRPAKDRELEEQLERIRLVRAHAARLRHRVERPLTTVPAR